MDFSRINKKQEAKKHTMRHYARRIIFSGVWLIAVMILFQVLLLLDFFSKLGQNSPYVMQALATLGVGVMIYIINEKSNPAYKIAWIIPIMLFPLVGSLLYLFVKFNVGTLGPKRILKKILKETEEYSHTEPNVKKHVEQEDISVIKLSNYIEKAGGYPTWGNTDMKYFSAGEKVIDTLLEELGKAEKFIFLEYYIVEEGILWNRILKILEQKAKDGLDVRILYDDLGCVATLPRNYHIRLRKKGIKARKYATLIPILSTHINNRDHRKMIVIDGKTAFSGGMNLSDEYINAYEKYGYWKDNAFLIKGEAVHNFTLMFLQMWNTMSVDKKEDYKKYLIREKKQEVISEKGYVIPYGDGPHQVEDVAKHIYMDVIHRAKEYIYIMTPYLILDHEMQQALMHASRSGIDVRIIMPHIPDKKYVFDIGRTHYPQLLRSGVQIYEYLPGFVHSKTFLSDDEIAVAGTINLDFRSLYLKYECGTLFYKTSGINQIKADFLDTFDKSQRVGLEEYDKTSMFHRMIGRILRVFGPLM